VLLVLKRSDKPKQNEYTKHILTTLFLATMLIANMWKMEFLPPEVWMPPEQQLWATHLTGSVILPDYTKIPAESLFDTGCVNANYISGDYFDEHLRS
jgi:hypothetical protein